MSQSNISSRELKPSTGDMSIVENMSFLIENEPSYLKGKEDNECDWG